jgi:hypothetical protein
MSELDAEIAFFEAHNAEFEKHHDGKWVLVHAGSAVGFYDEFDAAANEAVSKFGRGPYLIRQIGAPPMVLPASVMYRFSSASG